MRRSENSNAPEGAARAGRPKITWKRLLTRRTFPSYFSFEPQVVSSIAEQLGVENLGTAETSSKEDG